ncbi:MAG TPA: GTP cyclohydrolase I [Allosphingosinicella sp.]|jgi:GTP cyclohydrolase I|uniref:GTP cyclohydrolase I n=1 Tax=Allosphingosinicella sp. TaxID=2823234 RepID=UPI002F2732A2
MRDGGPFGFIPNEEVRTALEPSFDRISRAYSELFSGYALRADDVLNETLRVTDYQGWITVDKISFYTFCQHHFLPFFGEASVSYLPGQVITGLGKIVRLVRDVHARRLQIQETMARDICDDMTRVLGAKGVQVTLRAKHLCMCSRGPGDDNSETEVTYSIGEPR